MGLMSFEASIPNPILFCFDSQRSVCIWFEEMVAKA